VIVQAKCNKDSLHPDIAKLLVAWITTHVTVFYFGLDRYLHIIDGNLRASYAFRGEFYLHWFCLVDFDFPFAVPLLEEV
jgi:hypothetical protein